ncbi:MAG: Asp-tRNA(Asn)/Glu-tRNA(Gln) amidotransferase subunit GatC [Candidatus Omnitrophota bacterium]
MSETAGRKTSSIDVVYVADLAKLELSSEESTRLGKQLNDILAYIDTLNSVDTRATAPMSHPLSLHNVFREDVIQVSLAPAEALSIAPSKEGTFFKVPKVIE